MVNIFVYLRLPPELLLPPLGRELPDDLEGAEYERLLDLAGAE